MTIFNTDEILAPDPELEVLHDREYRVRAFRKDPNLLVRGSVRDQKPPRLYIEADDQHAITMRAIISRELERDPSQISVLRSSAKRAIAARTNFFANLTVIAPGGLP